MEKLVFELRDIQAMDENGEKRKVTGRPAVYNQLSQDLGGFRERIMPGAFTKTLSESNYKSLWNHNTDYVLGSRKAGNLTIIEDDQGLHFEVEPPETQWARDFLVSIERGDVDQMSFMFRTVKDRWLEDENGDVIRELLEVQLFEVSPVTFPAYPQTEVGLRELGMDPKQYAKLSAKAKVGQLSDEDKSEISSMIEKLSAFIGEEEEEPDPSDHSTKDEPVKNTELEERERYFASVIK